MTTAALVVGIGLLGGAGAVARFLLDGAVSARSGSSFPFGTLAVNLTGAFLLGVVVGAAVSGDAYRLVATAALGAFTTFSTWMFETHRLAEEGELPGATLNVGVSLALGLLAVWLGRELGGAL
jgi:fluoride exporter